MRAARRGFRIVRPPPKAAIRSLSPTDRQAAYEAADAGSTPARDARTRLAQRQSSPFTPGRPAVRVRHRVPSPAILPSPRRWQSGRLRPAVDRVPRTRWFESIPAHPRFRGPADRTPASEAGVAGSIPAGSTPDERHTRSHARAVRESPAKRFRPVRLRLRPRSRTFPAGWARCCG